MDFRAAPLPAEFTWLAPRGGPTAKSKTAAATFGGKKIQVQTPECATRLFADASSKTLYLDLPDASDVHREFAAFVQAFEDYAAVKFPEVECSPSLRNGSLRLVAWDDVQWFDAQGAFLKDSPKVVQKCACVLEFAGCWVSAARWGLKWRVVQVQVFPGDDAVHTTVQRPPAPSLAAYAFVD